MKTNFLFSFRRIFFFPAFLSRLSGGLSAVFVLLWLAACSRPLCEGADCLRRLPAEGGICNAAASRNYCINVFLLTNSQI